MSRPYFAAIVSTLLLAASYTYTYAESPLPQSKDKAPHFKKVHVGLSIQFVEIVGITPKVHHITTTMEAGISVAYILTSKWSLIGSASLVTTLDSTSLGGSIVLAADYNLYRSGPYRFGFGPDLGFVHIRTRSSAPDWVDTSVIMGGLGINLGLGNATLMTGMGAGYTPQFGGSWSLAFRLGVSANF